ncbi:MAG: flagellar hook protein FlgE [Candidatus Xenobiia bacterium LiM19]
MPSGLSNAISGLTNFQKLIDVVGNNIANLNTPGYKASNVTFKELMSQTIKGASASSEGRGGTNPMQLGLGTTMGSIEQSQTQGPVEITGKSTDFAITGGGYFIMKDGETVRFSRNGNFSIDANGDLVNSIGMKLQGWTNVDSTTGEVDTQGGASTITPINVPLGSAVSAKASTVCNFSGNLDASGVPASAGPPAVAATTYATKFTAYDIMGGATEVTLTFTKTAVSPPTWTYAASGNGSSGNGTLVFTSEGKYNSAASTIGAITYTPTNGASNVSVTPDFTLATQLDTDSSTVIAKNQDGCKAGSLETFTVDSNGLIVGNFTNGNTESLGQIAMANFTNPTGLNKVENGLYIPSANSGIALVGTANTGSRGSISSSALEQSNVDLGAEFTKMIVAQRAFQANSRIVTTYDEILNEVSNLKR